MPDGHNEEIGALKTSVEFLREGQDRIEQGMTEFRQEVRDGMRELRDATKERMDDHSKRLRGLESWRDRLSGAKGVIVALWGSLVALTLAGISLVWDWIRGQ